MGLPPGTKIGKYEVVERTAIGGQAIVYKCYDAMLDRHVAVKQISSHLAEDPKFIERFRKEAQILARLGTTQPAIVTIHELIEEPRGLFIVMEFVAGHTLETTLQDNPGPVPSKAALQIIWRLAAALHDVHAAGIIHRDIKPSNIIVAEGLRPKITDFGVAASATGQTSMLLGTTKYMAPELFTGDEVDGRGDLYSLGMVAYEMLLGRAKFNEVFAEVVRDPHSESLRWMKWHGNLELTAPPLHEVDPSLAPALSDLVARMMAKKRDERFTSMEELGRAIKTTFSPRKGPAVAAPKARRRRVPAAAGSGVRVALGGDEGDELEITDATPTAQLPKKPLAMSVKLGLAGGALACLLAFGGYLGYQSYARNKEIRQTVERAYNTASAQYAARNYKEAAAAFEKLAVNGEYRRTLQGAQATVMAPLARARDLSANAKDPNDQQDAAAEEAKASEAVNLVQNTRSDLNQWTRDRQREIQDEIVGRRNAWQFLDIMTKAKEKLGLGAFQDALGGLHLGLDGMSLSADQNAQVKALEEQVALAQILKECKDQVQLGDDLVKQLKLSDANKAYLKGKELLESSAADVIPADQRQALQKGVSDKITIMASKQALSDVLKKADKALADGDKTAAVAALGDALRIEPSDELTHRITTLKSELEYDKAQEALKANDVPVATQHFQKAIEINPQNTAAATALKNIGQAVARAKLLAEGDTLKAAGKYSEAIVKYQAGQEISSDPDVNAKIIDCRWLAQMAVATKALSDKLWDKAIQEYEKLKEIKPDQADAIASLQAQARDMKDCQTLLDSGDKALANQQWSDARSFYKAARDKNPALAPTVDEKIKEANYQDFKSQGQDEMDKKDYGSAFGHFKLAKLQKDTPEINDKIAEAQRHLPKEQP